MARMPIERYKVVGVRDENETVKTWQLAAESGENMQFSPGQFALIYLLDRQGNPTGDVRPYSMSSPPLKRECIEFTIKMTPNFPRKLLDLGVGSVVGVAGPSGVFVLDESLPEIVFIVGGIGVAGVSSAIRYVLEKQLPIKMTLLYSSSYRKEFIWMNEFSRLADKHNNFTFVPVVTREKLDGWNGETGRINLDMVMKYADVQNVHYYLCGSTPMVAGIEEMLGTVGIDRSMITMEKWAGVDNK